MKAPDLLPKNRKVAIHWTIRTVVDSPLYGKMETMATACGQKMDADGWASRAATEKHRITCRVCFEIANRPHSGAASSDSVPLQ